MVKNTKALISLHTHLYHLAESAPGVFALAGGALAWANNIPVTPGTGYTVTVGGGGSGSGATGNGGDSFFVSAATLVARGGRGAFINAQGDRAGGAGGTWEVGPTLTSSGGSNGGEGGGWLPDDSQRPVHLQQLCLCTEPHVMLGSLEQAVDITLQQVCPASGVLSQPRRA